MKQAIILCSGGLDSVVTANYVKRKNYARLKLLFFDYGQRALDQERKMAKLCAKKLDGEFTEVNLKDIGKISDSLINKEGIVNKLSREDLKDTKKECESWYVPCRNLIFLSCALTFAEAEFIKTGDVSAIFVGFKNEGKEHYPDTTQKFIDKLNNVGEEICKSKFEIFAPMIKKDKEDIILLGINLGVDFTETFSCYIGHENHCGDCLNCKLRQEGFRWAGIEDPTDYLKQ